MIKEKGSSRKKPYITIFVVLVIIVAFAVAAIHYSRPSTNDLRIIQYQREFLDKQDIGEGDYMLNWWVGAKILNSGTNDVDGAEFVVELKEDHSTINSSSTSFSLQAGSETIKSVIIQAKESEVLGKDCVLVATIYLGSEVLDHYTTSWQVTTEG